MANDKELGLKIHRVLVDLGLETPMVARKDESLDMSLDAKRHEVKVQIFNALETLGLDLEDDSLQDTPARVAKMWCDEVFSGLDYANFPKCTTVENKFGSEMVVVRDIIVRSTCEHHLQPIYGKAHIAYIPGDKVLGLSKFSRVLDFFACRPQVQERLTEQVYAALSEILQTESIAVVIESEHFCMKMRGVRDACASTTTSKMGGKFFSEHSARVEVLQLMKGLTSG
jgi:GTP cyclohydrolase I